MNALRPAAGLLALCVFAQNALAALELAAPFTDHAVLQRDAVVPVWGWDAQPGATVTVAYRDQTKETRVNASGVWRAELEPMPASAAGADLVITGSTTITLHDVVVGEVWIASGQSNMEWSMHGTRGYAEEAARPANPLIRHLRVDRAPSDLPVARVKTSGWQSAAPDTLGGFTGVGYFFARLVSDRLKVPVGIIHSSWGGTPAESWISEPVLRNTRAWPRFNLNWQAALKVFPQKYAEQPALEAAWQKALEDYRTTGKRGTMTWPRPPMGPGSAYAPGRLFNGMITPLAPYALRGALWYQGESNVGHADEYAELLPALIQSWRAAWPLGDFPFLVVQLPNFADNQPAGRGWAQLREAQESAAHVPGAAVAVVIDGDEPDNLHPVNKRLPGERLALIALHRIYDQRATVWSGPVVQSITREGAALRVRFSSAAGLKSTTPEIAGFELAGADQVFQPATVIIDGTSVLVSSPAVAEPVAVRHAYTNAPTVSLFNAAGLPAAPFRSDDW